MKKLMVLIASALLITSACKKEDSIELKSTQVSFNLKVTSFDIQVSSFKGTTTDPFDAFKQQFPIGATVIFRDTINDRTFEFNTKELTLETFRFNLSTGTYKFSSHGGEGGECNSVMSYNSPDQTVIITASTTSIPITLHATCAVIVIADPSSLIDVNNQPNVLAITDQLNGNVWTPRTFNFYIVNPTLRYLYVLPNSKSVLSIYKTDGTSLIVNGTEGFKLGYMYKILIDPTLTGNIYNPIFKETDTVNF